MPRASKFVQKTVEWASYLVKGTGYDIEDLHGDVFGHVLDTLTPELVLALINDNADGELGEAQAIGDIAAFYGQDLSVPEALHSFVADLVADEVVDSINDMGYRAPYGHR